MDLVPATPEAIQRAHDHIARYPSKHIAEVSDMMLHPDDQLALTGRTASAVIAVIHYRKK